MLMILLLSKLQLFSRFNLIKIGPLTVCLHITRTLPKTIIPVQAKFCGNIGNVNARTCSE